MFKVIFLISGAGSNLNAVIEKNNNQYLDIQIAKVISDNEKAKGLDIAKYNKIDTETFDRKKYNSKEISDNILKSIKDLNVDLIVCAGFLTILTGEILKQFKNKIINIHPSLIPSFCGKGMYGKKVHEAVHKAGVKISGCTVHIVNNEIDRGPIIAQRSTEVFFDDTPEDISERVRKIEHKMLVKTIRLISLGNLIIVENKTRKRV